MALTNCYPILWRTQYWQIKALVADERVIERLQAQGKTAVIPPKHNRTRPRDYDRDLYKARQRK